MASNQNVSPPENPFARRLWTNALVPVVALAVLAASLAWQFWKVESANGWVTHSLNVLRELNLLASDVQRTESGERGYLLTLKPSFAGPYHQSRARTLSELQALEGMVADNPTQSAAVRRLATTFNAWDANAQLEARLAERHDPGFLPFLEGGHGAGLMQDMWTQIESFRSREDALLANRQMRQRRSMARTGTIGAITVVVVAIFFVFFARRQYRQLSRDYAENIALIQNQKNELETRADENAHLADQIRSQNEELLRQNVEMTQMARQSEVASKLKSDFLANMSHQLSAPLQTIIGNTEMVLASSQAKLDQRGRNNLDYVQQNARHLLTLLDDMLDISKIEAGKLTLSPAAVDLRRLVSGVADLMRTEAENKGIDFATWVSPELSNLVTDETKLRQILINLVSNAIKYTRQGGVIVEARPKGADRFTVEVTDTGIGIPPEQQQAIFDEFHPAGPDHVRDIGTTGLGLAISRRLAKVLGGDLTVRSAPREGSTFTLELPHALPGASAAPPSAAAAYAYPAAAGAHQTVVVLDDDPDMLSRLGRAMRNTPFTMVPAGSGESAVQLAHELHPCAVMLDLAMPRVDGWQMLRELKRDPATEQLPVYLITCVDDTIQGLNLGAADYLTKPVSREELLATVERTLPLGPAGRGTVLLVEDDPEARAFYHETLGQAQATVIEAADARAAIRQLTHQPVGLVIVDLMLPGQDGFAIIAWLHAQAGQRQVPAVVLTGRGLSSEDLTRLAAAETPEGGVVQPVGQLLAQTPCAPPSAP